jgi:hypothetical protein
LDWSTWVPVAISAGALGVAVWTRIDSHAERRERREQAAEEKAAREHEAAELRNRIARNETAHLGARQQEVRTVNDWDTYVFTIENAGPAVARWVIARLVEYDPETRATIDTLAIETVKTAIGVGRDVRIEMSIPSAVGHLPPMLELRADWQDDRDTHTDEWLLNVDPRPDPTLQIY